MAEKQTDFLQQKDFIEIISENGEKARHYYALLNYLPDEFKAIPEKELNETEEKKLNGTQKLKTFLKKKSLKCPDDNILIWILRNCKCNIEKSEKKIIKFLETRSFFLENAAEISSKKVEAILDDLMFCVLPYTDKNGHVLITANPNVNLDAYTMDDVTYCFGAFLLCLLTCPIITVTGLSFLMECETPSISVLYPITKAYIRHTSHAFNLPLRFKRLEFLNANSIVRWCYNIVRPIFPLKLTKRITFHSSGYESLHKRYHPDILPLELGGTLGPLNNKCYKKRVLDFIEKSKREKEQENI